MGTYFAQLGKYWNYFDEGNEQLIDHEIWGIVYSQGNSL